MTRLTPTVARLVAALVVMLTFAGINGCAEPVEDINFVSTPLRSEVVICRRVEVQTNRCRYVAGVPGRLCWP